MDTRKGPGGRPGHGVRTKNNFNIPSNAYDVKQPRMADEEYRRLSRLPFSDLSREESGALCAEARRRNARFWFRYDPREFRGARYWERGFLSCVVAGGRIPEGATEDCFRIPRNRLVFEALLSLQKSGFTDMRKAGVYAKYDLLVALLRGNGKYEEAGGEAYLSEIEGLAGIPAAAKSFAAGILARRLGADI